VASFADTITGFGSDDILRFAAADIDSDAGTTLAISATNGAGGAAISAGATVLFSNLAAGGAVNAAAAAANVLRATSTTATTWSDALNGGAWTVNAGNTFLATWYDSVNGRMVVGTVTSADATVNGADTFTIVAVVGMTAAEYSAMTISQFGWI